MHKIPNLVKSHHFELKLVPIRQKVKFIDFWCSYIIPRLVLCNDLKNEVRWANTFWRKCIGVLDYKSACPIKDPRQEFQDNLISSFLLNNEPFFEFIRNGCS